MVERGVSGIFSSAYIDGLLTSKHSFVQEPLLPCGSLKVTRSASSFSRRPDEAFVVQISYVRPCEAFRGLGHVLGVLRCPLVTQDCTAVMEEDEDLDSGGLGGQDEATMMERLPIDEKAHFETMGTMIDCSRNGVLLVKTVKFLLKKLALMGYNMM